MSSWSARELKWNIIKRRIRSERTNGEKWERIRRADEEKYVGDGGGARTPKSTLAKQFLWRLYSIVYRKWWCVVWPYIISFDSYILFICSAPRTYCNYVSVRSWDRKSSTHRRLDVQSPSFWDASDAERSAESFVERYNLSFTFVRCCCHRRILCHR